MPNMNKDKGNNSRTFSHLADTMEAFSATGEKLHTCVKMLSITGK